MIATILLKATLLLVLAWTLTRVLRNRSAASRHFVWCVALAGCVALVAISYFAPPLTVKVPEPVAKAAPAIVLPQTPAPVEITTASPAPPSSKTELPSLPTLWLVGLVATLAWSLAGHIALARVAHKAKPAGTIEGVRIGITDRISAPVTCGWRAPVILLPVEADEWPEERRRAALLHELAHIARGDFFTQAAARLVAALYWFHPLAWMAVARLRAESEHACDDRVLSGGMTAADYASHLLAVAHGALARRHGAVFGVAMARPSELENRLIAVLDETRSRVLLSRKTAAVVATLVAIVLLPVAAAKDRKEDAPSSVANHNIPASPGETLTLELPTGSGIEIAGWDEPRVHVQVFFRADDADDTNVHVARAENGVLIKSSYVGKSPVQSSSLLMKIRAPRRYNLEIDSAGGTVDLTDLEGTFHGTTGGGRMKLQKLTGMAEISSGGGAITVTDSHLRGHVSTGGGRVTISRVRGGLLGSSGSGPVIYTDDFEKDSRLRIEKPGGPIELDEAPDGAVVSTGGGDIRIGRAAGHIKAMTGAGDVSINVENFNDVVDVTTGSGTVTIQLPANVDARFELETAYTENFKRATRIESDWEVEQRTSPTWEDQEGTPRRYVRARGTVGSGRGLVRIKAINGDVVVRKR